MSGKLISREPVVHACHPAERLVPISEDDLLLRKVGTHTVHDDSAQYRNGDVWECDDCHRRWTLNWSGSVEKGYRSKGQWHGSMRIMPCRTDWVSESPRKWKRRMKESQ